MFLLVNFNFSENIKKIINTLIHVTWVLRNLNYNIPEILCLYLTSNVFIFYSWSWNKYTKLKLRQIIVELKTPPKKINTYLIYTNQHVIFNNFYIHMYISLSLIFLIYLLCCVFFFPLNLFIFITLNWLRNERETPQTQQQAAAANKI